MSQSPMTSEVATPAWTRWGQLVLGIVCLVMIANLQYGWTLFIDPIDQKYHWGRAAIQVAFTIYIVTETWVAPIGGYLIDRFGPRIMVCGSGALVAIAWVINSVADSLALLVRRRGRRWPRRGPDLRSDCRQRAEVVSRPAGSRHGIDGRRLRRGLGPDGRAACQHDPVERL